MFTALDVSLLFLLSKNNSGSHALWKEETDSSMELKCWCLGLLGTLAADHRDLAVVSCSHKVAQSSHAHHSFVMRTFLFRSVQLC